jgi:hypothetical protein
MKPCIAVQERGGYKDTLRAHRYFAVFAKYFTVCSTYQPVYVALKIILKWPNINYPSRPVSRLLIFPAYPTHYIPWVEFIFPTLSFSRL